jgi:hypothetical protein
VCGKLGGGQGVSVSSARFFPLLYLIPSSSSCYFSRVFFYVIKRICSWIFSFNFLLMK